MSSAAARPPAVVGRGLKKAFSLKNGAPVQALADVSFEVGAGGLAALVGSDGAGKTTLMRLAAGLLALDGGELTVLGIDAGRDPQAIQDRIGYMPQRFGLYEDLTVQENLDLYADLHGVPAAERAERYPALMHMTALGPFTGRLAGRLSGGMKQKLGLACTLVRSPELLLLDEPTVGVDPLSRRDLWAIIGALVRDQGLTVLMSTSYLDEAERCERVIVLNAGKVLAQGPPATVSALAQGRTFLAAPPKGQSARLIQARLLDDPTIIDASPQAGEVRIVRRTGVPTGVLAGLELAPVPAMFEDGFMVLLHADRGSSPGAAAKGVAGRAPLAPTAAGPHPGEFEIEVRDLVRRFGAFLAVDHVSFDVRHGEIFGLLGPNGAGKTTTFRMLCGLLRASGGTLRVAGADVLRSPASARERIGYVAQKFSLYGQLSVAENLEFFARAYGLAGARRRERIDWAMAEFELEAYRSQLSGLLPGGYKQRLAMAAALLHQPHILFLDEATSGADPIARREFWRRITAYAENGVTIIVTTHFMAEAEYCDRIAIMDSGRVLAQGSPAEIRARGRPSEGRRPTMDDAFVAIVEEARGQADREAAA